MSKRTENKYLAVAVKVDGEEVMALIRPFGGDHYIRAENHCGDKYFIFINDKKKEMKK